MAHLCQPGLPKNSSMASENSAPTWDQVFKYECSGRRFTFQTITARPPHPQRYSWTMAFHPACSSGWLDRGWHETRRPCIHMAFDGMETVLISTCCQPATRHSTLKSCSGSGSCACWKVKSPLSAMCWRELSVELLSMAGMKGGAV